MRHTRITTIAIMTTLSVALAATSADAGHVHARKHAGAGAWHLGVMDAGGGYVYGPRYGYQPYPSYWSGPTTGVYAVDPSLCYAPRAYPGWWWHWKLENIC
jgi:hypothetical protein